MAKPYFALNLDVGGKPCLVIGGDGEALEKSERLLEAQADLLVVAKRAIPELVEFLTKHGGKLELREVTPADISGKFFVLNCVKTDPNCPNSPAKLKQAVELSKQGKSLAEIQAAMFPNGNVKAPAKAGRPEESPTAVYKVPIEGSPVRGKATAPVTLVECRQRGSGSRQPPSCRSHL